jgi:hypothetical protein
MTTQCSDGQLELHGLGRREVVARFDAAPITSDGGGVLLREVDLRVNVLGRLGACFVDHRNPDLIEHTVTELVSQRVLGLALGYEDLNDHDRLRQDSLLGVLVGREDPERALAGKSTLNRLELTPWDADASDRYKKVVARPGAMDGLLVELFLEAHAAPPRRIWLDLDATDDPLHGTQEGRFFHGYYGHYCYLPLYLFAGEHLLCARLRESNIDAAAGAVAELERIVGRIRQAWPEVEVVIRADSGFCREEIMAWCEANRVEYVLGLAKNERLNAAIGDALARSAARHRASGQAAREYVELRYQTKKTWTRARRVVGKAEYLAKGANPRFVVTSLTPEEVGAQTLYEELYCARGDMENRIKEQQLMLFADRTSTATLRANQLRLYFSSFAYVLLAALRRLGLAGTELARAQCDTIRLKLLKVGAQLKVTVRRLWLSLSEAYPGVRLFAQVYRNLMRWPVYSRSG